MALADMNIRVGADIADALTKINQLKQANLGLAEETSTLTKEYNKNAKELRALEDQQKKGIGVTDASIKKVQDLARAQKILATSIVDNKTVLNQSNTAIKNFDKSQQDAVKSTGSLTGGLKGAYSALSKIANIIPGLGIAGIFGAAITAISAFADETDSAALAQKSLNDALAEATGSVAGEIAGLNSLVAIAKNTSLSYETRTQAINQLNKEYPELHGNINLENIGTKAVTAQINKEIEAIQRRSKAKSIEKLIDEASIDLEKAKIAAGSRRTSDFQEFINKVTKGLGAPGLLQANPVGELIDRQLQDAQTRLDLFSKQLLELNTAAAQAGTLFVPPPPPHAKVEKSAKKLAIEYTETLQHALDEIFKKGFQTPEDPFKDLLKTAKGKVGVDFSAIQGNLDAIKAAQDAAAALQQRLDNIAGLALDVLTPAFNQLFTSIADGSTSAFEAFGNALKSIVTQLAATIAKAAALAAIMSFIFPGSTLGKLGFKSLFNKFLGFAEGGEVKGPGSGKSDSILARVSKGEYIIPADKVKKYGVPFFDKIRNGQQPPSFFNGIPKFALGGFVSPSLVGSIGGGQQIFISKSVIRGQDIVTSFYRASGTINRNG